MEEKDLFDVFREESENLVEQPQAETWQRLEKRLITSRKRRHKRKPVPTHWLVVAVTILLIIIVGVVSWVVTLEHEALLRGKKEFAALQFLGGKWSASEGKIANEIVFEANNPTILRGVKTLKFKDVLVKRDTFLIQSKGKHNIFTYKNQNYKLKNTDSHTFTFSANDDSSIHLRKSSDSRFTLSFDEGVIFVYKKIH
jgi:hypothetical protein